MDDPIELDTLSEACPNLQRLKIMLCGVWEDDKLFWMYFSRLTTLHIKTSSTETLLSFMKYNISVVQMKISCPNEVKSKFNDAFIQTLCNRKGGFLPLLKSLTFCSKFPFGFKSAQTLIENLDSLQYIGPMEMFSKLSKTDVLDLVKWIKDHNWDIVLGYKSVEYNVFEIDLSEPWKYKFVPDVGRVPVRKTPAKRLLSVSCSGHSEDDEEASSGSDGRKRSRLNSYYLSPSQASTTRVGSLKKSIEHEITEFEFEFCLDSDGFIKNKEYKIPNYQLKSRTEPKTTDLEDEYYSEYEDYEEDTMDVEDIPEDADFEWCWDEEGRLRIDEIEKEDMERNSMKAAEEQGMPEEVVNGVKLKEVEKVSLEIAETELSFSSGKAEQFLIVEKKIQGGKPESLDDKSHVVEVKTVGKSDDSSKKALDNSATDAVLPRIPDKSVSLEETCLSRHSESLQAEVSLGLEQTSSSRRAQKRFAQITPPPANAEKKEIVTVSNREQDTANNFRSSIIPPKAPKAELQRSGTSDMAKTSKIASMFERQKENNNSGTNLSRNPIMRNQSSSNINAMNKPKTLDLKPKQAPAPAQKTQVIEVFEYDPLLGYCTVKRKTVPINENPESVQSPSVSANLTFIQSPTKEEKIEENVTQNAFRTLKEEEKVAPEKDISESISQELCENENPSSGTSSKENKVPNSQEKKSEEAAMIPLTGISKYDDIPFLNNILGQKSIPEPPKSKPPKLPDSKLPLPKLNTAASKEKKEAPSIPSEIKVEIKEETQVNVTVTVPQEKEEPVTKEPEQGKQKKNSGGVNEAREWYWDYDQECWKECDPDEEYEWEYIEDEEEEKNKASNEEIQATVKLSDKSKSQQNTLEASKDEAGAKKDKKSDLPKDECKFSNMPDYLKFNYFL